MLKGTAHPKVKILTLFTLRVDMYRLMTFFLKDEHKVNTHSNRIRAK